MKTLKFLSFFFSFLLIACDQGGGKTDASTDRDTPNERQELVTDTAIVRPRALPDPIQFSDLYEIENLDWTA